MATKLRPVVIYGANGTSRRTHPLKPTMKTNELTKDQVEEAISIAAPFSRSNPPNHINILTDAAREWLEMRDARLLASGIIEANRNLTSEADSLRAQLAEERIRHDNDFTAAKCRVESLEKQLAEERSAGLTLQQQLLAAELEKERLREALLNIKNIDHEDYSVRADSIATKALSQSTPSPLLATVKQMAKALKLCGPDANDMTFLDRFRQWECPECGSRISGYLGDMNHNTNCKWFKRADALSAAKKENLI